MLITTNKLKQSAKETLVSLGIGIKIAALMKLGIFLTTSAAIDYNASNQDTQLKNVISFFFNGVSEEDRIINLEKNYDLQYLLQSFNWLKKQEFVPQNSYITNNVKNYKYLNIINNDDGLYINAFANSLNNSIFFSNDFLHSIGKMKNSVTINNFNGKNFNYYNSLILMNSFEDKEILIDYILFHEAAHLNQFHLNFIKKIDIVIPDDSLLKSYKLISSFKENHADILSLILLSKYKNLDFNQFKNYLDSVILFRRETATISTSFDTHSFYGTYAFRQSIDEVIFNSLKNEKDFSKINNYITKIILENPYQYYDYKEKVKYDSQRSTFFEEQDYKKFINSINEIGEELNLNLNLPKENYKNFSQKAKKISTKIRMEFKSNDVLDNIIYKRLIENVCQINNQELLLDEKRLPYNQSYYKMLSIIEEQDKIFAKNIASYKPDERLEITYFSNKIN